MNQEKIGKFIKEKRKEKDLTQEELASKLRVSNRTISKWENGVCLPDYAMINDLCKELDISINEFLSGEEIEEESYQKTLEENMIKSINYKVKKNNAKIVFMSIIGFIILFILGFVFHHIYFYLSNNSVENINYRSKDLETRKIVYDKVTSNDLANQNIDNKFSIYIPEDWKLENDVSKSTLVDSNCRIFFKNYSTNDDEVGGFIKVCMNDVYGYNDIDYKEHELYSTYGRYIKYLNMKDINIFSSKYDILVYNSLTSEFSNGCIGSDPAVFCNSDITTHIVEDNGNHKAIYDIAKYETRKLIDLYGVYDSPIYFKISNSYDKYELRYHLWIFDRNNYLSDEDIEKIINSFKPIIQEMDF